MYEHFFSYSKNELKRSNSLHFASHSHHPWPDCTRQAQVQYWEDSNRLLDNKWDYLFGEVYPKAQRIVANVLGLKNSDSIVFSINTHEFVYRVFSCYPNRKLSCLSTDGEFHSFARQAKRLEEVGANFEYIECEDDNFEEKFIHKTKKNYFDVIFLSHTFFKSGKRISDHLLDELLAYQKQNQDTAIVIDLYHSFFTKQFDFSKYESNFFFTGGSYKYAHSGENACFLTVPSTFQLNPVNTGWFAGFSDLEGRPDQVNFSNSGQRFAGATFDFTGLYRLIASYETIYQKHPLEETHQYVMDLKNYFLNKNRDIMTGSDDLQTHFVSLKTQKASAIFEELKNKDVIVDYRENYLRFGFGIYQTQDEVDQLYELFVLIHKTI